MGKSSTSVLVWGIYLLVIGVTFIVMPNTPLTILGFGASKEIWPRVLGIVVAVLGYYHVMAGRSEGMVSFHRWTVYGRWAAVVVFVLLVVLQLGKPQLLLFAGLDFLGALWTWLSLRSS